MATVWGTRMDSDWRRSRESNPILSFCYIRLTGGGLSRWAPATFFLNGGLGGIRTHMRLVRSEVLIHFSYQTLVVSRAGLEPAFRP